MSINGKVLLDCEINLKIIQGAREDELEKIVLSHKIIQKARDDFLNGLLTSWEYLELLESHEVNVDLYMSNIDSNLQEIGIII